MTEQEIKARGERILQGFVALTPARDLPLAIPFYRAGVDLLVGLAVDIHRIAELLEAQAACGRSTASPRKGDPS